MTVKTPIRVLLVEDEEGDAQLVKIDLRQAHGETFTVTWVESLREMQQCLQTSSFDVLLLDLSLPDSDGLATIAKARLLVGDIPVIVLTGRGDTDFALKALELGAADYVIKGNFGFDGLARTIRYALFRADMEARNNLLVAALEAAANSIIITDKNANIKWVNSAFTRLSGYSVEEAIGKNTKDLIKSNAQDKAFYQALWADILQGKHWRGELINRRKDGSLYHEELSIAPVKDATGEITHFIGIKNDISERKQLEEQLQKMANTDPLTELYNRRVFLEQLAQETARLARFENQSAALLMLDLDYFKRINDTYGHSTGDEVLRKFASIVREISRTIDIPARLGGEEFAILLPGATKADAMAMAERLRQQIANAVIPHKKGSVRITVSIGAAALSADDSGGDQVLSHADAALYKAKEAGRNQCCWFDVKTIKNQIIINKKYE
jgi:diguanylate cyclase (GGDEF)-like protein/PAS domain S-box-containing protein